MVEPVEDPAPVAVDCMQLFSNMLICEILRLKSRDSVRLNVLQIAFHATNETTQAVMETPKLQPILSVV